MPTDHNEGLREEWEEESMFTGGDIPNYVVEWWLSKITLARIEAREEERKRALGILTDEITLAHTTPELAGGKTSRLTSAYNRIADSTPE